MKIVFIAGLLTTGWDGKNNEFIASKVREAEKYQIALINVGIGCFCPHTHSSFHHEKGSTASEDFYHEMDFEILKRIADAVLAIPGWEKSIGAKKEIKWAIANHVKVFYPKSPEDIQDIILWAKQNN